MSAHLFKPSEKTPKVAGPPVVHSKKAKGGPHLARPSVFSPCSSTDPGSHRHLSAVVLKLTYSSKQENTMSGATTQAGRWLAVSPDLRYLNKDSNIWKSGLEIGPWARTLETHGVCSYL